MNYKLCYQKQNANKYHKYITTNNYEFACFEKENLKNKTIKNRKTLRIVKNPHFTIFTIKKSEAKRLFKRCPF